MLKHNKYLLSFILICVLILSTGTGVYSQDEDSIYTSVDTIPPESVIAPYDSDEDEYDAVKVDDITTSDKSVIKVRSSDESKKSELLQDEDFWYANKDRKKKEKKTKEEKPSDTFIDKQWFKTLLWFIIVGAFVVIIIWFLLASNVNLFRKRPSVIAAEKDDLENENIFDIDYDKQIAKAKNSKDYRLAVRYMYLQLLRLMADRNIIQYKQERTNTDYLFQLYKSAYYDDFFRMTRHFEYSWYGQFNISEQAFEVIQQDYYNFKNRLV